MHINNQNLRLVARSLDPEAVSPKDNELIEFCGRLAYARGLAHGAALEPHVAHALHWCAILHASVLMFFCLACARPGAQNLINNAVFQVCNEHEEGKLMLQSFVMQTMFMPQTRGCKLHLLVNFCEQDIVFH